ncbi:MAG: GNAT family N-acetyltransferase [Anaerolineaceae bacterium]|nr:GNAT family N-acetyltransferase [Anaerolineaceae bacterium]
MSIIIEKIDTSLAFRALKEEWNHLLNYSPVQSIFLTWEWLFTWWEYFGSEKTLYILLARESGELAGIAPLMIDSVKRLGITFKMLRNMGMPDVDVAGFIVKGERMEIVEAFSQEIYKDSNGWSILELGEFPSEAYDIQRILRAFPKPRHLIRLMPKPHTFIPTTGDWEEYYCTMSKHHRRSMRKKERLLKDEHKSMEYERLNNGKAGAEHFNTIFKINAEARFPELYATEPLRNFHLALAAPEVLQRSVDISLLRVDNIPIAFEYGFLYNGVYEAWRGAFLPSCYEYSPGSLVFLNLLQNNFAAGLQGVDLLRGEHDYKRRWRGYDRSFTLLRVVPRKNPLACAAYVWLPDLKKWLQKLRHSDKENRTGEEKDD